jgi:hypothetical protein
MRGSTNCSSYEGTMTSPRALAAMSFIVIHRVWMNKKKQRIFSSGLHSHVWHPSGTVTIVFVFWIP